MCWSVSYASIYGNVSQNMMIRILVSVYPAEMTRQTPGNLPAIIMVRIKGGTCNNNNNDDDDQSDKQNAAQCKQKFVLTGTGTGEVRRFI